MASTTTSDLSAPPAASIMRLSEDKFTYEIDAGGIPADELHIEQKDDELIIAGQQENTVDGKEQSFERRVRIPAGIVPETIRCTEGEEGRVIITGKKTFGVEQPKQAFIPFEDGGAEQLLGNTTESTGNLAEKIEKLR
jgi:hypothetical protein